MNDVTTTEERNVADIIWLEGVYPRNAFDQDTVSRYRQSLDFLPPIQITHENILIDGYHRLIAHRIEQRQMIRVDVEHLEEVDILWEATKRNACHGLQLSLEDKRKLARTFFSNGHSKTNADIAAVLSVSEASLSRWLRDLKEAQDAERDGRIWEMWLACHTEQQIADAVNISRSQVSRIVSGVQNLQMQEMHTPDSLQVYNLWNFQRNDDRYGLDYPGRIPGQIVENVLYYYTSLFDTVVDPMAGGGTTLDVCRQMDRRYRCYDINPVRDDIHAWDITNGFPAETKDCNLIFLDPPYWSQKRGEYSAHGTNLANLDMPNFYDAMRSIIKDAYRTLRVGGHIAVIIGPTQEQGKIHDHARVIYAILEQQWFEFVNRIIVPYTTQQAQPYHVADAQEKRYMLKLYRDLLIFQKIEKNGVSGQSATT